MKLEEILGNLPDDNAFKLAVINVQSALVVSKETLQQISMRRSGHITTPTNAEMIKLASMILEQEAYLSEAMEVGDASAE